MDSWSYAFKRSIAQIVVVVVLVVWTIVMFEIGVGYGIYFMITATP